MTCPCATPWRPADRSRLVVSTGSRYTLEQLTPGRLRRWWWTLRGRSVDLYRYRYLAAECAAGYYAPHGPARSPLRAKPWTRVCGRCLRPIRSGQRWTHEGALAMHRACLPHQPAQEGARP